MKTSALTGEQVYLAAYDIEKGATATARWIQDSEYTRLADSEPARLSTSNQIRKFFEEEMADAIIFSIYTLAEDKLLGDIGLGGIDWAAGSAWVGIALGEREYWGKGYGSDAMRVLLRFAFQQLNLHRINLDVFEYNPRAIRSYEKVGFRHEGCARKWVNRDGRRWDFIFMGLLRDEWEAAQNLAEQEG